MRTNLALADLGDLLERPVLAVLATRRRDDSVMLSPVYFEWDGSALVIWSTGEADGKVRHLRADPRATIVVAEGELPYRSVEFTGRAEITRDGFAEAARRINERYVPAAAAAAMSEGFRDRGVLIRVQPERIRAWDFVDDLEALAPGGAI